MWIHVVKTNQALFLPAVDGLPGYPRVFECCYKQIKTVKHLWTIVAFATDSITQEQHWATWVCSRI